MSLLHVTPQLTESPACTGLGFTISQQARQLWQAESSSTCAYGWTVRLLLLPTPPHSGAVAVGYRPENVYLEGTYTPLFSFTNNVRSQAHWDAAQRRPDFSPDI